MPEALAISAPFPRPAAALRLFCIPSAGASGSSMFRRWARDLPASIELCAVDLPGRWGRYETEPFRRMSDLIDALEHRVAPMLDRPFALLGHSLGGLVAYELARTLEGAGFRVEHLFLAATGTEILVDVDHRYPSDEGFLASVARALGSPHAEVAKLADMAAPGLVAGLRADFELIEHYVYEPGTPLRCPITALAGSRDHVAPPRSMERWAAATANRFNLSTFEGDHFFLRALELDVMHAITTHLGTKSPGETDAIRP
jgi:medium-chain acyl-[acyl-carrier-protein] hydrolase